MVAAPPPPASASGSLPSPVDPPCLGVLFVHGAGDHGIGVTLVEFGEPLVAWLDGWLRHGDTSQSIATDRALTGATQIIVREGDTHAPAHSLITLRPQGQSEHRWLLAEARWDEAFTPPGFQQVLLWSIGVVPWTVLTQFIGPLARQAKNVEPNPYSVGVYLIRAFASAAAALVVSALVLTLAILILVLSFIPLDSVRDIVSRIQRWASTNVGDLYLVLTSPIQRAALFSAVQRDIDWLQDQGVKRVAVIAHSQGGYVAYQALTGPSHRTADAFVTFGSGLVRLTESERARRTSALVLALIGTVGALVAIRFAPIALLGEAGIWDKRQADSLAFLIGLTVSMLLVYVLWRYFHEDSKVEDLPAPPPGKEPTSWTDLLTTEDPVMNRRREGRYPPTVRTIRVQNRGSVLADHGGYWQNDDQFVPHVAQIVAALDDSLELLSAGPNLPAVAGPASPASTAGAPGGPPGGPPLNRATFLDRTYTRRRGRVSALKRRTNLIILATAGLIAWLLFRGGELEAIGKPVLAWLESLPEFLTAWVPDVVTTILPIDGFETIVLGAVVIVILSAIANWVGSQLWNRWSAAETDLQFRGEPFDRTAAPAVTFYVWTLAQLVVMFLVAVIGPAQIIEAVRAWFVQRDEIVQAWSRVYVWSLLVGLVAFLWAYSTEDKGTLQARRIRVIGAIALALSIALVFAILVPGPTRLEQAVPIGFAVAILALLLAWILWAFMKWIVDRLAKYVEYDEDQILEADPAASVIDYAGFVGLFVAGLAALLVFVVPTKLVPDDEMHLYRFGSAIAVVAYVLGVLLLLHGPPMSLRDGLIWLLSKIKPINRVGSAFERMTPEKATPVMRLLVGLVAVVLALWTFAVGWTHMIALGGPID
jgi:hypothetical protein